MLTQAPPILVRVADANDRLANALPLDKINGYTLPTFATPMVTPSAGFVEHVINIILTKVLVRFSSQVPYEALSMR